MRSGGRRGPFHSGSLLLLCNILLFTVAAARSQAQEPATAQPDSSAAQKTEPTPSKANPAANVTLGTFDADTANSEDKSKTPAAPTEPRPSARVTLGTGDLVEVSVYNVPELSTKTRITSGGDVYLPLINYVHVEDLSVEEAQRLIEKRLADGGFVRDPHVSILIDEFSSQGVSMLGEIARPGVYPVLGDRRLFDMITTAGGLTDKAGRKVSITHRDQPDKIETIELSRNITDKPESNVAVFPGDTIEVQRAPIIYVVGDVGRPAGLMVDNGTLTVLQALALSGGANRTAKLNDTRILRKSDGPNGMTETKVPLKKMMEAKAPDIPLQANDILFVPLSGAKVAATRSFEAAMAITTSLAIYAVHP
jgi:polysaccharide export outer membrane protein